MITLTEWYRAGHNTLLKCRRAFLLDNELTVRQWSDGLRMIDGVERYLLTMLHKDKQWSKRKDAESHLSAGS
jgi:hypothetical protein